MSPIGVFSLVFGAILEQEKLGFVAEALGFYTLCCFLSSFVQGLIVLPLLQLADSF